MSILAAKQSLLFTELLVEFRLVYNFAYSPLLLKQCFPNLKEIREFYTDKDTHRDKVH